MTPSSPLEPRALAVGIAGPLGVVALAYILWWVSDRLLYIGPFDRAAFGWAVVMPLWWLSPAVAALLWRRLPPRGHTIAAAAIATSLAAFAVVLMWTTLGREMDACPNGPRTPLGQLAVPIVLIGLLIGGGWAVSARTASSMVRGGLVWRGLGAGVGLLVAATFAVIVGAALALVLFTGCNRPT